MSSTRMFPFKYTKATNDVGKTVYFRLLSSRVERADNYHIWSPLTGELMLRATPAELRAIANIIEGLDDGSV